MQAWSENVSVTEPPRFETGSEMTEELTYIPVIPSRITTHSVDFLLKPVTANQSDLQLLNSFFVFSFSNEYTSTNLKEMWFD